MTLNLRIDEVYSILNAPLDDDALIDSLPPVYQEVGILIAQGADVDAIAEPLTQLYTQLETICTAHLTEPIRYVKRAITAGLIPVEPYHLEVKSVLTMLEGVALKPLYGSFDTHMRPLIHAVSNREVLDIEYARENIPIVAEILGHYMAQGDDAAIAKLSFYHDVLASMHEESIDWIAHENETQIIPAKELHIGLNETLSYIYGIGQVVSSYIDEKCGGLELSPSVLELKTQFFEKYLTSKEFRKYALTLDDKEFENLTMVDAYVETIIGS